MSVKSIWQMACPKCGSDEHIDITALIVVRLTEDGTDADAPVHRDHEWDENSPAHCEKCGMHGVAGDFLAREDQQTI